MFGFVKVLKLSQFLLTHYLPKTNSLFFFSMTNEHFVKNTLSEVLSIWFALFILQLKEFHELNVLNFL